jgi:hypothetical protein
MDELTDPPEQDKLTFKTLSQVAVFAASRLSSCKYTPILFASRGMGRIVPHFVNIMTRLRKSVKLIDGVKSTTPHT